MSVTGMVLDKCPAAVCGGTLFFRLPDGSTVTCECIKGDAAHMIVAAIRNYGAVRADAVIERAISGGSLILAGDGER